MTPDLPATLEADLPDYVRELETAAHYLPLAQREQLRRAWSIGAAAHAGQTRKSGEPYITHPVAVARVLADQGLDVETLVAAILHDTLEDTPLTPESITTEFGGTVTSEAPEGRGPYRIPLYEMSWGHTRMHVNREHPEIVSNVGLYLDPDLVGAIRRSHRRFAHLPGMHFEAKRFDGRLSFQGSPFFHRLPQLPSSDANASTITRRAPILTSSRSNQGDSPSILLRMKEGARVVRRRHGEPEPSLARADARNPTIR